MVKRKRKKIDLQEDGKGRRRTRDELPDVDVVSAMSGNVSSRLREAFRLRDDGDSNEGDTLVGMYNE
jgi:hypothetical protein